MRRFTGDVGDGWPSLPLLQMADPRSIDVALPVQSPQHIIYYNDSLASINQIYVASVSEIILVTRHAHHSRPQVNEKPDWKNSPEGGFLLHQQPFIMAVIMATNTSNCPMSYLPLPSLAFYASTCQQTIVNLYFGNSDLATLDKPL